MDLLNDAGKDGWGLVDITDNMIAIRKRQIEEDLRHDAKAPGLGSRRVEYRAVAIGNGPRPRGSAGDFDRGIGELSDGAPVGVDNTHLEAFDGVLLELDVHRSGPRAGARSS
jgi:hypothetical protein